MNLLSRSLAIATLVGILAITGWCAPVVPNGSFELDVLSSPFAGNASTVQNWTFSGGGDGPHWAVGYNEGGGFEITTAGQGNQFVTMGGGSESVGTGTWSQNISGFTVGLPYIMSFMLASETPSDTNQVVTARVVDGVLGTQQQDFTAPTSSGNYWRTWSTFNFQFTAGATTEQIVFTSTTFRDVGLDNVTINQVQAGVPEPGTWGLIGAGIAALAMFRRQVK